MVNIKKAIGSTIVGISLGAGVLFTPIIPEGTYILLVVLVILNMNSQEIKILYIQRLKIILVNSRIENYIMKGLQGYTVLRVMQLVIYFVEI